MKNIINYINSQGRFKTNNEIIESSFWFVVSSMLNLVKPKINYNKKKYNINYFGITLAGSGSGKSFAYSESKKLFSDQIKKYSDVLLHDFKDKNQEIEITIDGQDISIEKFAPEFENSIEGTSEGLYLRALFLDTIASGSLNVVHEEIMDIIKESNINKLKEIYDGSFKGKIIKGQANKNIYNLIANMLVFGSSIALKRDKNTWEAFNKSIGSGIYRRSFIFYQEPSAIQKHTDKLEFDIDKINKYILNIEEFIKKNIHSVVSKFSYPTIFVDIDATEYLNGINDELLYFANQHIDDERYSAEIGSFDKILKLAGLHSILNGEDKISQNNIEYAYNFYLRCRESTEALFNIESQANRIYKILRNNGKMTKSQILEKEFFNRATFNEDLLLVEEIAYQNSMVLKIIGSKIKSYKLEDMPKTDMNKIIVSVPKVDKREKTTDYISYELPFFGDKGSIEKLCTTESVSNFCLVHFDNGKRKSDKALEGQNCIGIDVDNGASLQETIDKLQGLIYIIYTTKSHQKDKGGIICDRYRILLPTKTKFFVDNEKHKELITNLCEALDVGSYDVSTRNIDRLWFNNPIGEIFKNEYGDLIDVTPFLPETNKAIEIKQQVESIKDYEYDDKDEIERRIFGMVKWTLNNAYPSNRNNALFRLGAFVGSIAGLDRALYEVEKVNNMLSEPMNIKELKQTVFKSLSRKFT